MIDTRFDGTAYIDGSKAGTPVKVEILPGNLRLDPGNGAALDLNVRTSRFDKGGYNDEQLVATGQTDQGQAVLLYVTPLRKAAKAVLAFGADRETEATLVKLVGGGGKRLKILGFLGAGGVVVYLLYLLVSVLGVYAVDLAVEQVPVEMEEELGKQAAGQSLGAGRVCAAPAMNQAVVVIMDRLTAAVGEDETYTFRFYVIDSPDVNAFALPGGYIFVNSGLIEKADSPEEVAGVLAHEMTHVLERHGLRNVMARAGMWLIVGILFGDATGAGGLIAGGASELLNLSFSRVQEDAADMGGLELLYAAEIDPQGLPDFFEKLMEKEAELGVAIPSFMSSHPETKERIRIIREEIDSRGQKAWKPLDIDWKAAKETCDPTPTSDPEQTAREFANPEPDPKSENPSRELDEHPAVGGAF